MKKRANSMVLRFIEVLIFVVCVILFSEVFLGKTSHAATAQEISAAVHSALALFSQQVKGGNEFLKNAKGVLVIPNIVKVGFGVGAQYGEGALLVGGKTVDHYSLTAGSIGLQIGAQKHNLIVVFREDGALKKFRTSSGWKVGADGSVAFIDMGAGKSVDTISTGDPIVAFLFGHKGLMANATIEGGKFTKIVR
jgi:lipid-binding SYLF domain-containing protein